MAVAACRVRSGAVSRQVLEQALRSECRDLLLVVDGATVLDLLMTHTFGEEGGWGGASGGSSSGCAGHG